MRVWRAFGRKCLVIHPVLMGNAGKGRAAREVYGAEEAIGLAKAVGWDVDYAGMGEWETEGNEEEKDEWQNPSLRESLALHSLLRVRQPLSSHFLGKGQLSTIHSRLISHSISLVFLNTSLTPLQHRNLEKYPLNRAWNTDKSHPVSVIDRMGVILKIFSERARTKIAKLQLELAWMKYVKSRLVRGESGTFTGMLSLNEGPMKGEEDMQEMEVVSARERGGVGTMAGQGETQLEVERRLVSDREAKIRQELQKARDKVVKNPGVKMYPTVAIIGYTNAGKTALMNYLTGTELLSENMLFQTLSTTARQLELPSGQLVLLLDTVGFISDLPHDLVEAFKATLEGAQTADVLLHIRDISHPMSEQQQQVVLTVLAELGTKQLQDNYVEAWNKVDRLEHAIDLRLAETSPFPVVPISALHGINCLKLLRILDEVACKVMKKRHLRLSFPSTEYRQRIQWLTQNLNMALKDIQPKGDNMEVGVVIDDTTLKRYLAYFNEEQVGYR